MKLLGIAFLFLAVLCVCTVGEDGIQATTVSAATSAVASKAEVEPVNTTSQTTTSAMTVLRTTSAVPVLATTIRTANETITSGPTSSSPNATTQRTQGTTTQPPPAVTSAANTSFSTTNTTQVSGTQSAKNESLDAASTTGSSLSSTVSPERNISASGTLGLPVTSPTSLTTSASPKSSSGNQTQTGSDIPYSNVILPIVITLIVITLSAFSLVALYKMCQKKTPERQENGAEQAQSDKEGVKLLSVKTTSPEAVSVEVGDTYEVGFSLPSANLSEPTTPPPSGEVSQGRTTGEHSSHGKNKTRQLFTSQQ